MAFGIFNTGSAVGGAIAPPVIAILIVALDWRWAFAITGMIAIAQESGEIAVKTAPDRLARQLMMTMAGGAAMVKGVLPPEAFAETVNDLIDSWT